MPYIYKYKDKNDDLIKYVGIIKSDSNFPKRFIQHKSDDWYKSGEWEIQYAKVPTRTDAEMLEAHLIEKYGTAEFYNKAKKGWGECTFNPDAELYLNWEKYDGEAFNKSFMSELYEIKAEINCHEDMVIHLANKARKIMKDIKRVQSASIREWFRQTFSTPFGHEPFPNTYRYSIEDCFAHYCKWAADYDLYVAGIYRGPAYNFCDIAEFLDTILGVDELQRHYNNNCICGVIQTNSSEYKEYMKKQQEQAVRTLKYLF